MKRAIWRVIFGWMVMVCIGMPSALALVETDNHLLEVLKTQGYTVVQDFGEIHAKKQWLPLGNF
ncbi:MAG: hypothetical protein EOL87_18570 [Spartobacteria bacterium]|nr:hypothetical protein [Spartobacteria bacterium]